MSNKIVLGKYLIENATRTFEEDLMKIRIWCDTLCGVSEDGIHDIVKSSTQSLLQLFEPFLMRYFTSDLIL
jgi:hypothetical protein